MNLGNDTFGTLTSGNGDFSMLSSWLENNIDVVVKHLADDLLVPLFEYLCKQCSVKYFELENKRLSNKSYDNSR